MTLNDLKRICLKSPYISLVQVTPAGGPWEGMEHAREFYVISNCCSACAVRVRLSDDELARLPPIKLLMRLFGRDVLRKHPKRAFMVLGFPEEVYGS